MDSSIPSRLFRGCGFLLVFVFWCLSVGNTQGADTLSNAEVDRFNVHLGTQTFAGLYQFTTNSLLVETAEAIHELGSDILKGYLGPDFPRQYRIPLDSRVTNLLSLARDEPSCRHVLDMPFRHYVFWAYPFGNFWPFDGYSTAERANEYRQIYDLAGYLLTNYNNTGKTFYLGHWEGDWYLLPNYNVTTNPTQTAISGMIEWLNNRQKAIDDAKKDYAHTNVEVFCYAEVNRVRDALVGGPAANQRMINRVVPFVTNLDFVSWSAYDGMDLGTADLRLTLDYLKSKIPSGKATSTDGQRFWVGEYGWGALTPAQQEPKTREFISRLMGSAPRFILFWEIYNNETNRNFCLIDSHQVKVETYYLHQRFINQAKLLTARFREGRGRLPNDTEFAGFISPLLSQSLTAPVRLRMSDAQVLLIHSRSATCISQLAQGVYGDEQASVRVSWGRVAGGASLGSWEHSRTVAINTNFVPATFRTVLTELEPDSQYYVRFSATNSQSEAWAPTATAFRTARYENPPVVGVSSAKSGFEVSWPSEVSGYQLFTCTNLATTTLWIPATNEVQFRSNAWVALILPEPGQTRFYRLQLE